MLIGQLAIMVTVVGWLVFVVLTLTRSSITGAPGRPALDLATIGYLVIMSLLACSALAYLITRLGYYYPDAHHRRATRAELSQPFERSAPSLTVLVPSYQEDERVIRMTCSRPRCRSTPTCGVVLLIDDPPEPKYAKPAAMLAGGASACRARSRPLLAVPDAARSSARSRDWDEHFKTRPASRRSTTCSTCREPLRVRRRAGCATLRRPTTRSSTTPTASSSSTSSARSPPTWRPTREALRAAAADDAARLTHDRLR